MKLPGAGTYYARIYGSDPASYNLKFTATALSSSQENQPNGSTATADAVVALQAITARLSSSSDIDYFKLSTTAAGLVSVKFQAPAGNYSDYYLAAYDASGNTLGRWITKASASYIFNTVAVGDYYLKVSGASAGVYDADYLLTLGQAGAGADYELEPNNSLATANTVVLSQSISGQSDNNESDYYKVVVPAANAGVFSVNLSTDSTTASWYLDIINSAGNSLGSQYGIRNDTLSVKLPGAGTYYARIYGSDPASYNLKFAATAFSSKQENEPNSSTATADAVVALQSITARLSSSSDIDYFKLSTTAVGLVSVNFQAPTGNYSDYYLTAYDTNGNTLGRWITKVSASYIFNTASVGDYYLKVSGTSSGIYDADYLLTLGQAGAGAGYELEPNNSLATANTAVLSQSISGQSDNNESDYYRTYAKEI